MKKSFTLIEVLVAVFVFVIMFLIAAAFINLATGQTKSSQTQTLTTDLRNTMDIINQKMNGANAQGGAPPVNGFRVINHLLAIASSDGQCTLIGLNTQTFGAGYLAMKTAACGPGWPSNNPTQGDLAQRLTPSTINVTNFTVIDHNPMLNQNIAPYLNLSITAQTTDPKFPDSITLQTAYSMDYLTVRKLQ